MSTFRVWAPEAQRVDVQAAGRRTAMVRGADGWWSADVANAGHGSDYAFVVDGGEPLPDPRSPWQPAGVHAPSRTVDHARFAWTDAHWRGVPLAGSILYELHVGTFTDEGTFDAAVGHLDHLVELGVDVVELLPVNAFDGTHGWGYDGVALYAVHEPYGGPEGLKRFVDAAHARGLGVVLDVVYNHLGPSGNYLSRFGPYFTVSHSTPWGPAVNLDGPGSDEVRSFIVDNAVGWLRDYHLDGLRLDAVHALVDQRAVHVLEEVADAVHALGAQVGKPLFVVAESDQNDPRLVRARDAGGYGLDGQWSDDFHHALHAALTGERQGYYVDFGALATLAKALRHGFVHDGSYSTFRGRRHGRRLDTTRIPGHRLLGYLQNHDQVGNRAKGDRLGAVLTPGLLRVGAVLVLTSPFTPMLFMGEEWGAGTPWQFFSSFEEPELAEAVRTGRRAEFAEHGWAAEEVPDPQDPATRHRSVLDWAEPGRDPHAELLDWHRSLIRLRRSRAELCDGRLDRVRCAYDEQARWFVLARGGIRVACNLGDEPVEVPLQAAAAPTLLLASAEVSLSGDRLRLPPESVAVLDVG